MVYRFTRQGTLESEEEHRLIARYAARLARREKPHWTSSESAEPTDMSRQRELVAQLEAKNR